MLYGTVIAVDRPAPNLVRVVMGGEGLARFEPNGFTDAYVNVAIPPVGAPYRAPFDLDEVGARFGPEQRPHRRRYTVRRWNAAVRELTLEFVVHGDEGVGGSWAASAAPGDVLVFTGPGGGYRPDGEVGLHLLVGDESALPAIAASLEALRPTARAIVRIVVDGPRHEVALASPARMDLRWLHRTGDTAEDERLLVDTVADLTLPDPTLPGSRVQAFVHGEAAEVRAIRRHLLVERGMPRADLSCSPYWRRHLTDEVWRERKPAWTAELERDVA